MELNPTKNTGGEKYVMPVYRSTKTKEEKTVQIFSLLGKGEKCTIHRKADTVAITTLRP